MKLFGTDGVRGLVGKEIDCELALALGRAYGSILGSGAKVVVAKDTRLSSDCLEGALAAGLSECGVDVYLMGVAPTPAVAFSVRKNSFEGGIMISASHNPPQFNGIKFFSHDGFKLCDNLERRIEERIYSKDFAFKQQGKIRLLERGSKDYVDYLKSLNLSAKGLRICVDCGHGAASAMAANVFRSMGADTKMVASKGNGGLINVRNGAVSPKTMVDFVYAKHLDIGFSFDGDADRIIMSEGKRVLDGDAVLYLLAKRLDSEKTIKNRTIVGTVMTNSGLVEALNQMGFELIRTPVGDKYVIDRMRYTGSELGGESSGHIIVARHSTTGDAMLSAMLVLDYLYTSGQTISEALSDYNPHFLSHTSIPISQKCLDFASSEQFNALMERLKEEFSDMRLIVRPSGTEPILRITVESKKQEDGEYAAQMIKTEIQITLAGLD